MLGETLVKWWVWGGWTWAGRWFTQPSKHHGSCFLPHAVSTLPIHLARCRPPSLAICVVSHEWLSYTQSIIFTGRCCCDISKVTTGNTLIFFFSGLLRRNKVHSTLSAFISESVYIRGFFYTWTSGSARGFCRLTGSICLLLSPQYSLSHWEKTG